MDSEISYPYSKRFVFLSKLFVVQNSHFCRILNPISISVDPDYV